MKRFMNKRVVGIGLAVGLTLGAAGAAFAFFSSTGNGTGSASVGSGSNWSVAQTGSSGTLYPCGSSFPQTGCSANQETITYTVTNNSTGAQQITYANLKTAIDANSGNVTTGGTNSQPNNAVYPTSNLTGSSALTGCSATWFNSTITNLNGGTANVDVAGGGSATVVVTVGMIDSGTAQDVCSTHSPNVDLWVS